MTIDSGQILSLARQYKPSMTVFLRDMVAIPSESRNKKAIIGRMKNYSSRI